MVKPIVNEELITKIAHLYYEDNLSVSQVSELVGLTRQTVSKAIIKAKTYGIVKILIIDKYDKQLVELEEKAEKELGLKNVYLTEVNNYKDDYLVKNVAQFGAKVFLRLLSPNMKIGVTLSRTMYWLTRYLEDGIVNYLQGLVIVEITGGMNRISNIFVGSDIPRLLASKLNAEIFYLQAPAFTKDKATRDAMLRDDNINKTLSETIDLFFVGIGNTSPSTILIKNNIVEPPEYKELLNKKAVGVINCSFYNLNGEVIDFPGNDRSIAVPIKKLINHSFSVGLAGGMDKEEAILGAIRGKFINSLITDVGTLKKVLKIKNI